MLKLLKSTFINSIIIIYLPIILIIILLRPFIKIKIGEIETRAIGHSSLSIEIFLCEIYNRNIKKKNSEIYLFFVNKKISNKFLYKKFKKKFIIFPRLILEPLFKFFLNKKIFKEFLVPYRHWKLKKKWQIIDINNVLEKVP